MSMNRIKLKCANKRCILFGKERWFKENSLHDFMCHCGERLVMYNDSYRRRNQIEKAKQDFDWHSIRASE